MKYKNNYKIRRRKQRMPWLQIFAVILVPLCIFILYGTLHKSSGTQISSAASFHGSTAESYAALRISDTMFTDNWNMLLVDKNNCLPLDFNVELTPLENGNAVDKRIYEDLQAMMTSAKNDGYELFICSSYRTQEKQTSLSNTDIQKYINQGYSEDDARKMSEKWVAIPGASEHQTGLALDIVAADYVVLDNSQENTPEQKWLIQNCSDYGFILRYPTDKSAITGIGYEPWHYRYVGLEAAKEITQKGLCLEEYLKK